MTIRDIPRDQWRDELDNFSRQHEGWAVSLKIDQPGGRTAVEAHDLPLQGVSPAAPHSSDIAIEIGNRPSHITHEVRDAKRVSVETTGDGAERALLIEAKDGSTARVEFRSPLRPEDVNGTAGPRRL